MQSHKDLLDGFDAVAARFAAAMAQADSPTEADKLLKELDFLERINRGGEFMPESDKDRVRAIAARSWRDAWGQQQPLLNEAEVTNLCITRGTLNDEERQAINRHIDITIDILEQLPFPPKLRRVPEYAGGHHERMDGRGFPRGLTRDQMSIPARMMGVADVFEALTAKERPYKPPMPPEGEAIQAVMAAGVRPGFVGKALGYQNHIKPMPGNGEHTGPEYLGQRH